MPHTPGGVPLCRRREHPRASRLQHESTNCLRFCEAALLLRNTSQSKYYRVHVQYKLSSNKRFQFSLTKDSWAHGARGFNPGPVSSLPVLFRPGLARAALVGPNSRVKYSRRLS